MSRDNRVVILGAGLTGLSASLHLSKDWDVEVLEREAEVGGVARTRQVDGFTFDYTGHLLHLRDEGVKQLVARLLPGKLRQCDRKAFIYSNGAYVPFPFQANLHGLPPAVVAECVTGFVKALLSPDKPEEAANFAEWSVRCFGAGIAKHFMIPYNSKLYARDLERVTADWVSWSVPRPSLEQVVQGALGIRNEGLGYNPTFLYPVEGGIDCLARALATEARGIRLESDVARVDLARKVVVLGDDTEYTYDRLVSTIPLQRFVALADPLPDWAKRAAADLAAVAVVDFNIGVARKDISPYSWVYVPEADYPFYRVGFPSTFAPSLCPEGTSSMYVEVSLAEGDRPDLDELEETVIDGLRRMGVLRKDDRIIARDRTVIDPAYVIFDAHRAAFRDKLLDLLLEHGVQSVGRYGAWTYSSMEDAILAGRQAAEVIMGVASATEHRAGDR